MSSPHRNIQIPGQFPAILPKYLTASEFSLTVFIMLVGLDVDGVVADFLGPFLRFVREKTGCEPIDAETVIDLSFKGHPLLTDAVMEDCLTALSRERDFWNDLTSLLTPAEWEALDALSRAERLVFITHRHGRDGYDVRQVTSDWLRRHGISRPVVHCTQDYKSKLVQMLGVKLFVDDRHENCQDVAEKTEAAVLMPHRRYNQSFTHPRVKRIQNLIELMDYLT